MQHSIRLAAGDMGRLKAIAGALGCLGTRQIGIGEPSVSEMMKKVASGDLAIVRKERTMNDTECQSCAESGEHGVPVTRRSINPDYSGYDLCDKCAAEYDSRMPATTEGHDPDGTYLWRHNKSGERFVVTVKAGHVVKAGGPLHYSTVSASLKNGFANDPELAGDIDGDQDSYELVEE